MKLRFMSVKQRLAGFAVISACIALLMWGVGYAAVRSLTSAMNGALVSTQALQNHTQADMRMDALRADVLRALHAVQTNSDAEKKAVKDQVEFDVAQLRDTVRANTELPLNPAIRAAFAKTAPLVEPFIAAAQQEVDLVWHDPAAASANYHAFTEGFGTLEENMDATRSLIDGSVKAHQRDAIATAGLANGGLLAMLAGGLLLIVVVTALVVRAITRPLVGMTDAMARLAAGDLSVPTPANERADEIGAMARAIKVFKQAALDKIGIEAEATQTRQRTDEERARNGAERESAEAHQAHVVKEIATGLARLSGGDLMFRLHEPFAPRYETLRADFNSAVTTLQETMAVISSNTAAIRSGTDEISSAADDLSRRTEQQAASLEETAAALDEITATVRKTAEGAKHAREAVATATSDADHSGQVVRHAVEAMNAIEQSAGQISQIIGVIDEIAFQTNLLALNAGVEAARAGDAGRGLRGRGVRGARPGPALGRGRQGDQGADLRIGQPGRARRGSRRPDRRGAATDLRPGGGDQRHRDGDCRIGAGTGDRPRPGQHRRQPDGPGHPAERRHGRAVDRRQPRAGAGDGGAFAPAGALPGGRGAVTTDGRTAPQGRRDAVEIAGLRGQARRRLENDRPRTGREKAGRGRRILGGILERPRRIVRRRDAILASCRSMPLQARRTASAWEHPVGSVLPLDPGSSGASSGLGRHALGES